MIKAVLFDLDGTLVSLHNRYVAAITEGIEEILGELPEQTIKKNLGDLLGILGKTGFLLIPRSLWRLGRKLGMSRFQALKYLYITKKKYDAYKFNFELLDGASNTLDYVFEHFQVGIVTSAFNDEIQMALEKIPYLQRVDTIVGFDDVSKPKPNKEPVEKAVRNLKLEKDEVIFVGDLPSDIISGNSAGVKTIAYTGEFHDYTLPLLEKENPDFIVTNQTELQDLLAGINKELFH